MTGAAPDLGDLLQARADELVTGTMGPSARAVAAEWARLVREQIEGELALLDEMILARTSEAVLQAQLHMTEQGTHVTMGNASRLAALALTGITAAATVTSEPADLADKALHSGLAHLGEPPDYAADNE